MSTLNIKSGGVFVPVLPGAQGETGPTGPTGPTGAQGPNYFYTGAEPAGAVDGDFWLDPDAIGAGVVVGTATSVLKATSTSRTSTTTPTIDPDLQLPLQAGTYHLQMNLVLSVEATGSTPGLKLTFDSSGGTVSNAIHAFGSDLNPSNGVAFGASVSISPATLNQVVQCATGYVVVSVASTIGLFWSQDDSSVDASTVHAGSYLIATKVL